MKRNGFLIFAVVILSILISACADDQVFSVGDFVTAVDSSEFVDASDGLDCSLRQGEVAVVRRVSCGEYGCQLEVYQDRGEYELACTGWVFTHQVQLANMLAEH